MCIGWSFWLGYVSLHLCLKEGYNGVVRVLCIGLCVVVRLRLFWLRKLFLPLLHYDPPPIGPHHHHPCKGRLSPDTATKAQGKCWSVHRETTSSCNPLASPLHGCCHTPTMPLEDTAQEPCIDSDWLALSVHPANAFRFTYQWKTLPGLCEHNFVGTAGEQIASINSLNILS